MKFLAGLVLAVACGAQAQFDILDGKTTASLRGIDAVSPQVAWASGSGGTVLLTTDGGKNWKHCAVPPGGEKLDFRGVQGFDAMTAIVMSSGKGDLSRLYKTIDGCVTWTLVMTNDEPDGFWDSIQMWNADYGFLAGDPISGQLFLTESTDYWGGFVGDLSYRLRVKGPGEAAFAASNSVLALGKFTKKDGEARDVWFGTGGTQGARVFHYQHFNGGEPERMSLATVEVPSFPKTASGGIFSLWFLANTTGVAVGGDYAKPNDSIGTAAFTKDAGKSWTASTNQPHGYRSAVTYDPSSKTWITVGPNGSDISKDDGKNWTPLKPSAQDAPDADKNWNAISLPFVVGSKGRIGKLNAKF